MESQEKNEPRGRGARVHELSRDDAGIDKTTSSRIVLVLRRRIFIGRERIPLGWICCAALLVLLTGCGRRSAARVPRPPAPAQIGSTETGIASWYGVPYHGRRSASGEIFDMEKLTAAHPALPFQTWVEVTNLSNGKQVDVRITDRGPFVRGRIIDLSMAAARQIDMVRAGTTRVRLRIIDPPASGLAVTQAPVNPLEDPSVPKPGYAVQAGAFSDPSRAEALRDSLSYSDVRVVKGPGDSSLWRVLVGHGLSVQAAAALAADVQKAAGEAFVIKEVAEE